MGNRPSPGPVFQRPVRQPGSAPYKPPLIPIRHGPPKIPNRYTPQQTAPSSNQATYVNPGLQGKNTFCYLFHLIPALYVDITKVTSYVKSVALF